ncbi:MAG: hypothetical protein HYY48_06295 [Gammaproteobacteria bacterium]|nr:hypothetical protein [Gammaproteobacteria bacterium]
MVLAGIALSSGRQVAVIEMPGVKGLSRAALGDEVGGWTVVRIEPEAISLKKGNEIKELVLMVRRSPAQPPKAEPNKAESNTEEVDAAEPAEDTEADTPEPSE